MNESCHIWMGHVTYEWVMSHMKESCHLWMSHVTYEWGTSHMNKARFMQLSAVCYKWMDIEDADTWCHGTLMNESCHTHEWAMPHMNVSLYTCEWFKLHIWMNHVTHTDESRDICMSHDSSICVTWFITNHVTLTNESRTMSHLQMSHVTDASGTSHTHEYSVLHMNWHWGRRHMKSCHTYEYVMSDTWMSHATHECVSVNTWMSHATHINEPCHTRKWVVSRMNVSCPLYMTHEFNVLWGGCDLIGLFCRIWSLL